MLRSLMMLIAGLAIGFACGQKVGVSRLSVCQGQVKSVVGDFRSLCESFNTMTTAAYRLMPNETQPAPLACAEAKATSK